MNTKEEIIYYCEESNPAGALMLTGEWGSGKTYLIENDIKDALNPTHIIIRISLFGISSIEELNRQVKKRWVDECASFYKAGDDDGVIALARSFVNVLGKLVPNGDKFSEAALSINPIDFIKIKPTVKDDKKVVLVFDDLERSKLDTVDILGCINEYCENLKFHVIIVANEEKVNKNKPFQSQAVININTEKDNNCCDNERLEPQIIKLKYEKDKNNNDISYKEIKEKIVCRTVRYAPDYNNIIRSIIEDKNNGFDIEYAQFLKENIEDIINLFIKVPIRDEGEQDNNNGYYEYPRNIRSLKYALHDYKRVYDILQDEELSKTEIKEGLISFIAYGIAVKANLIVRSDRYGYIISNDKFSRLFPFVNSKTLFRTEKDWIIDGIWSEEYLRQEIKQRKDTEERLKKSEEPKEVLKLNRLFDIDDEVIKVGFAPLLDECYCGLLDFNEYVQFICNSMLMRKNSFPQYKIIAWDRVIDGIKLLIKKIQSESNCEELIKKNRYHILIDDDLKKELTEKELIAYNTIVQFIDDGEIYFDQNRKKFIDSIKKESIRALELYGNKRFDRFDDELACVISECYESCTQADRHIFPTYFNGIW